MDKLFDYNNKIMQLLSKFADIMFISILWLLLSVTVIGFGPACTAAYYTITKTVRRSRGNILSEFWHALKSNFWNSLVLGILWILFALSLFFFDFADIANFLLYGQLLNIWTLVFSLIKAFVLLGLFLYLFPVQSRFQLKFVQVFLWSFIFILRHVGATLTMLIILVLSVSLIVIFPYFMIIVPGVFFLGISYPMEQVLKIHIPKEDKMENQEKDQWYLEK